MEGDSSNWSESVEDLVHGGELDKAISLLESAVSKLETPNSSQLDSFQLSSALCDLAKLYSTKGLSLKADEAWSRALILRARCHQTPPRLRDLEIAKDLSEKLGSPHEASASDVPLDDDGHQEKSVVLPHNASPPEECPDNGAYFCEGHLGKSSELYHNSSPHEGFAEDDWEAIADRAPVELLSPPCLPEVSKLSLEDTKTPIPKRRGKGTFSYMTRGLYSEQQFDGSAVHCSEGEGGCQSSEVDAQARNYYGTRHVLVLANFPSSTRTADLEKLLENFKVHGVVIRWVNDTVALAVFRTPAAALEACKHIQCPFTLRILDENDTLLKSIPQRDLEPPQQRPETSTRTARRLIAQGMGIKLPSTNFGSRELRKQEEARRNRIVSRRNLKDDAWGDDVN